MSLQQDIHISVVSPVYKAELIVDELVKRLTTELSQITDNYEILLVEDGGPDNSWQKIEEHGGCGRGARSVGQTRNSVRHGAVPDHPLL